MDRELSNSTEGNMTGTVFPEGVRFHVRDKKVFSLIGFLVVSLLLHGVLLVFFKFPHRFRFENTTSSLSVTLQTSEKPFDLSCSRRYRPPLLSCPLQLRHRARQEVVRKLPASTLSSRIFHIATTQAKRDREWKDLIS